MLSELLQMSLYKGRRKSWFCAGREGSFTTALCGGDWSGSRIGRSTPDELNHDFR